MASCRSFSRLLAIAFASIVDRDGYVNSVIAVLMAEGYCARWDGTELQVKNTSSFSEQYAIVVSDGWVRRGERDWRTCLLGLREGGCR